MSEWKEYKLGEIAEITSSKRIFYSEYVSSGVPFYRSKEIIDLFNKRSISTELYISEERYNEIESKFGVPHEGDILLTSVGSLGIPYKIGRSDKFYFKDGNLTWFRNLNRKIIDVDYLIYLLCSSIGKQKLDEVTIGSTQQALTISGLKTIKLLLPPLKEQERIVRILGSLEDKIDLLNRQNATLESLAETIFRNYFIDNPKSDWQEAKLGYYVDCVNGVSYTSDELKPSSTAMATLKSFHRNGGFRLDGYKEYVGKYNSAQLITEGDLLVAHTDITQDAAVIGNPILVIAEDRYDNFVFSMDLVKVIPNSIISKELCYLLMKDCRFKEHCLGYSNGSTVLHLSKKAIPEYEFNIPTKNIIDDLQCKTKPLLEKIFFNKKQINSLTTLRDTLIPKLLMSYEL